MDWSALDLIVQLPAPFDREGADILEELRTIARTDELTAKVKLAPALTSAKSKASALLKRAIIKPPPKDDRVVVVDPPVVVDLPDVTTHPDVTAANLAEVVEALRAAVTAKPGKRFTVSWREVG